MYRLKGGDNINVLKFDVLSSTSSYARENANCLSLPCIIVAYSQTNGRGRRGNSFYSPEGTGLYMTLLFEPKEMNPLFTPAAAVAVCEVIEKDFGITPQIKWVNDIFLEDKKVCGILCETFAANNKRLVSIGIGINLTTRNFPESLPDAASLGIECDKEALAEKISKAFLALTEPDKSDYILNEYEKRLFIIGRNIGFSENGVLYSAKVKGINEVCNLIVEMPDKKEKILSSGEISVKL